MHVARTLSAGAVIVRGHGEARRYLILRAYRNWDFPKGRVEPGEIRYRPRSARSKRRRP